MDMNDPVKELIKLPSTMTPALTRWWVDEKRLFVGTHQEIVERIARRELTRDATYVEVVKAADAEAMQAERADETRIGIARGEQIARDDATIRALLDEHDALAERVKAIRGCATNKARETTAEVARLTAKDALTCAEFAAAMREIERLRRGSYLRAPFEIAE